MSKECFCLKFRRKKDFEKVLFCVGQKNKFINGGLYKNERTKEKKKRLNFMLVHFISIIKLPMNFSDAYFTVKKIPHMRFQCKKRLKAFFENCRRKKKKKIQLKL